MEQRYPRLEELQKGLIDTDYFCRLRHKKEDDLEARKLAHYARASFGNG